MAEQLELLSLPEQYPPRAHTCPKCKAPIAYLKGIGSAVLVVNYARVTGGDISWSRRKHGQHRCRAPRSRIPDDRFLRDGFQMTHGRPPTDEELENIKAGYR